jgi:hypothetical protein
LADKETKDQAGLVSHLQSYRRSRPAIGISRKPIAAASLIKKPCLHDQGCHAFRDLSGSGRLPSIGGRRLRRYLSAPSPEKRLLPFHFGCPVVPPVSPASGVRGSNHTIAMR